MRYIVCGGREFTDRAFIFRTLDTVRKELGIDVVIEGDAPGVDRIAGYWARKRRLDNIKFPADWERHGRAAGPMRNAKMLFEGRPDGVIAFPGGRGTADMIARAERAGVPVLRVRVEEPAERETLPL